MRTVRLLPTLAAVLLIAQPAAVAGAERHEDAVGDALGGAPDIVAVTVDEPEGPVLRFSVEFASEPPLAFDETHTDLLWLALDTKDEVSFPELDGYSLGVVGGDASR